MPFLRRVQAIHVFTLLFIFWSTWLYTEVTEYVSRSAYQQEVNDFMHKGDRFTQQEGDALERRIKDLEIASIICRHHHGVKNNVEQPTD